MKFTVYVFYQGREIAREYHNTVEEAKAAAERMQTSNEFFIIIGW